MKNGFFNRVAALILCAVLIVASTNDSTVIVNAAESNSNDTVVSNSVVIMQVHTRGADVSTLPSESETDKCTISRDDSASTADDIVYNYQLKDGETYSSYLPSLTKDKGNDVLKGWVENLDTDVSEDGISKFDFKNAEAGVIYTLYPVFESDLEDLGSVTFHFDLDGGTFEDDTYTSDYTVKLRNKGTFSLPKVSKEDVSFLGWVKSDYKVPEDLANCDFFTVDDVEWADKNEYSLKAVYSEAAEGTVSYTLHLRGGEIANKTKVKNVTKVRENSDVVVWNMDISNRKDFVFPEYVDDDDCDQVGWSSVEFSNKNEINSFSIAEDTDWVDGSSYELWAVYEEDTYEENASENEASILLDNSSDDILETLDTILYGQVPINFRTAYGGYNTHTKTAVVMLKDGCAANISSVIANFSDGGTGAGNMFDTILIDSGITGIGTGVFQNYTGITKVYYPETLSTIGESAFAGCTSLIKFAPAESLNPAENTNDALALTSIGASAFKGDSKLETVTINSCEELKTIGASAFEGCTALNAFELSNVAPLASIGASAFKGCAKIKEINLNDFTTLSEIGASAFEGCTGLTTVDLTGCNVKTLSASIFKNCTSLDNFVIQNAVTAIGESAFYGCTSLSSICIPSAITENGIGTKAFAKCTKLKSIKIDSKTLKWVGTVWDEVTNLSTLVTTSNANFQSATNWKSAGRLVQVVAKEVETIDYGVITEYTDVVALNSTDTIKLYYSKISGKGWVVADPDTEAAIKDYTSTSDNLSGSVGKYLYTLYIDSGVTSIGNYAFAGFTNLMSVEIPDTVLSIGTHAFDGCTSLMKVTMPVTIEDNMGSKQVLTSIKDSAFNGCTKLTSVDLMETIETIELNAFKGCAALTKVIFPENLTTIGVSAFEGCTKLTINALPEMLMSIGDKAFKGCSSISGTVVIPSDCANLGVSAFEGCSSITEVALPKDLTTINSSLFKGCSKLKTITSWPTGLTIIKDNAFNGCAALTFTTFGQVQLSTIEANAFDGCKGLTAITLPNALTTIGSQAFQNCDNLYTITSGGVISNAIGANAFKVNAKNLPTKLVATNANNTNLKNYNWAGDNRYLVSDNNNVAISTGTFKYRKAITSGNCTIYIDNETGEAWVRATTKGTASTMATGTDNNYTDYAALWKQIKKIHFDTDVTTISAHAFDGCTNLTEVEVLGTITSVGEYAFNGCTKLATFTGNLGSVTTIGQYAFNKDGALTSLNLGNGSKLTSLGQYTFYGCGKLTFNGDLVFSKLQAVPDYAFDGCSKITSLSFGNNTALTSIGANAFLNCTGLEAIDLTGCTNLATLKEKAFSGCSKLTSIDLQKITAIPKQAFYDCRSLATIDHTNALDLTNAEGAFYNCSALTSVGSVTGTKIPKYCFCSSGITTFDFTQMGASLTEIGDYAFADCKNLQTPNFSANTGLRYIRQFAFFDDDSIKKVDLSKQTSLETIAEYAFGECSSVTDVILNGKETYHYNATNGLLQPYAFYACNSLRVIETKNPAVVRPEAMRINTKPTAISKHYASATLDKSSTQGQACDAIESFTSKCPNSTVNNIHTISPTSVSLLGTTYNGNNSSYAGKTYSVSRSSRSISSSSDTSTEVKGGLVVCNNCGRPNQYYGARSCTISGGYYIYTYSLYINDEFINSSEERKKTSMSHEGTCSGRCENCHGPVSVPLASHTHTFGYNSGTSYPTTSGTFYACETCKATSVVSPTTVYKHTCPYGYWKSGAADTVFVPTASTATKTTQVDAAYGYYKALPTQKATTSKNSTIACDIYGTTSAAPTALNLSAVPYTKFTADCKADYQKAPIFTYTGLGTHKVKVVGDNNGLLTFMMGTNYDKLEVTNDVATQDITPSGSEITRNKLFDVNYENTGSPFGKLFSYDIAVTLADTTDAAPNFYTQIPILFVNSTSGEAYITAGTKKNGSNTISEGNCSYSDYKRKSSLDDCLATHIGQDTIKKLYICEGVTEIGNYAFANMTALEEIHIPSTVNKIGDYAFYNCKKLSKTWASNCSVSPEVTEPGINLSGTAVTTIGKGAFYNTAITALKLPSTLTDIIGDSNSATATLGAFEDCTKLGKVTFPAGLKTIGNRAFYNACSANGKDHSIVIPDSVTTIGDYAFYMNNYDAPKVIGSSVKTIGVGAFYTLNAERGVTTGYDLVLPNTLTSLGKNAFFGQRIKNLSLPNSLTAIPDGAFQYCYTINKLTIPKTVKTIGNAAFGNALALKEVTFRGKDTAITQSAFSIPNASEFTVKVADDAYGIRGYSWLTDKRLVTFKKPYICTPVLAEKLETPYANEPINITLTYEDDERTEAQVTETTWQWYKATTNSIPGELEVEANKVNGATTPELTIPALAEPGSYYYYPVAKIEVENEMQVITPENPINVVITKAAPTFAEVVAGNMPRKEVPYEFSTRVKYKVVGVEGSEHKPSQTVTPTFYTDEACTVKTTTTNSGATSEGGAPKNMNTSTTPHYYVTLTSTADNYYKSVTSQGYEFTIVDMVCTTINPIEAYDFDGKAHTLTPVIAEGDDGREPANKNDTTWQWFMSKKQSDGSYAEATAVEETAKKAVNPHTYAIPASTKPGTYKFFIRAVVGDGTAAAKSTIDSTSIEVTINKATPTATTESVNKTFDNTPVRVPTITFKDITGYNVTSNPTYEYFKVAENGTETSVGSTAPTNAGEYKVKWSNPDSEYYKALTGEATFTISKATPTINIEASDAEFTGVAYDAGTKVTKSFTVINGAQPTTPITLTYYSNSTCSDASKMTETPKEVGTYFVKASSAADDNFNAGSTSTAVSFRITPKTISLALADNLDVTFTGEPITAGELTTGGTLDGFDMTAEPVIKYYTEYTDAEHNTPIVGSPEVVGTYYAVASVPAHGNYTAAVSNTATVTIIPANPTITLADDTDRVTYTGEPQTIKPATTTGKGDYPTTGEITYKYYSDKACSHPVTGTPVNGGTYYVMATVAADGNYNEATTGTPAKFIIKPSDEDKIVITKPNMVFDNNPKVATAKVTGIEGAAEPTGNVTITYWKDATCNTNEINAPTAVGKYYIKAVYAGDSNYATKTVTQLYEVVLRAAPDFQFESKIGNTITGFRLGNNVEAMEYKLASAGDNEWTPISSTDKTHYLKETGFEGLIKLPAGEYVIRYAATETEGASGQTDPIVVEDVAAPTLEETSSIANTIKNVTTAMEYALEGSDEWFTVGSTTKLEGETYISTKKTLAKLPGAIYNVRLKATKYSLPSQVSTVAVPNQVMTELEGADRNFNVINGVNSTMEYKLDTARTYTAVKAGATKVTKLTPGIYQVRLKATDMSLASEPIEVEVYPVATPDPAVCIGGVSTIEGVTNDMEYKLSTDKNWIAVTTEPKLIRLVAGDYNLRYKAGTDTLASDFITVTVEETPKPSLSSFTVTTSVIEGVNDSMEYRLLPSGQWTSVSEGASRLVRLVGGNYEIRYKEYGDFAASDAVSMTVPSVKAPSSSIVTQGEGIINGLTTKMEYRLVGSLTWAPVTENLKDEGMAAGSYEVRYMADGDLAASESITVRVTLKGAPDSGTVKGGVNCITGLDSTMEYKLSTASSWTAAPNSASKVTKLKAGKYNVRYAAKGSVDASEMITVVVSAVSAPEGVVGTVSVIKNVDDTMEYKKSSASSWKAVASGKTKITLLEEGTYNVRYAATDETLESEGINVKVSRAEAPTGVKGGQGTITGMNSEMEYAKSGSSSWTSGKSSITGLAAGRYDVRYAATSEVLASESVTVTVEEVQQSTGGTTGGNTGGTTGGNTGGQTGGTTGGNTGGQTGGVTGQTGHTHSWQLGTLDTTAGTATYVCSICGLKNVQNVKTSGSSTGEGDKGSAGTGTGTSGTGTTGTGTTGTGTTGKTDTDKTGTTGTGTTGGSTGNGNITDGTTTGGSTGIIGDESNKDDLVSESPYDKILQLVEGTDETLKSGKTESSNSNNDNSSTNGYVQYEDTADSYTGDLGGYDLQTGDDLETAGLVTIISGAESDSLDDLVFEPKSEYTDDEIAEIASIIMGKTSDSVTYDDVYKMYTAGQLGMERNDFNRLLEVMQLEPPTGFFDTLAGRIVIALIAVTVIGAIAAIIIINKRKRMAMVGDVVDSVDDSELTDNSEDSDE